MKIQAIEAKLVAIPDVLLTYADMFNSDLASVLLANKSTNYAINVVEGKEPLYRPLYSLSQRELTIL